MIRLAEERDVPRIRELHARIEERMEQKMDLPAIDDPAMLGFWVVEREGVVTQFFYIERALELCMGGEDPDGIDELREFQRYLVALMVKSKARVLHSHIPGQFPRIGKHLEDSGFTWTGFEHFILGLVEKSPMEKP